VAGSIIVVGSSATTELPVSVETQMHSDIGRLGISI
jgi:hypothetical protein